MSKISKAFKALSLIIKTPMLLNKVLDTPNVWNEYVRNKYHLDNGLPVVKPEQLFNNSEKTVNPYTFTKGGSLITDILLLKNAAKSFEKCQFFEFGTWRGEAVANVASVAKICCTLNLSEEDMLKLNLSRNYINQVGLFSKPINNIVHLQGNSLSFDYSGLNKKFDLIFIDGNHHYEFVKNDTKKTFKYLTHKNSIVIWHDYAYNPETVRNQVLAGILDGTPKEKHKYIYHVKGSMSAIYFPEEIKGKNLKHNATPEIYYKISTEKIQL